MKKQTILVLTVFLLSFSLGVIWHKKRLFPIKQLSKWLNPPKVDPYIYKIGTAKKEYREFLITKYTAGLPLFSDRNYHDSIGDPKLEGLYLIQIPRHYFKTLEIKIGEPVTIYRMLTEKNNNSAFKDWKRENIAIKIKGNSCTHSFVVSKDFGPGNYKLEIGGPVATSPILFKVKNKEVRKEPVILNI
jgi:hypothetical protein